MLYYLKRCANCAEELRENCSYNISLQILETIQNNTTLSLNLIQNDIDFMSGKFFEARNVKPSRKQILPLIKAIVDSFEANC
jgi:hypothetical protein